MNKGKIFQVIMFVALIMIFLIAGTTATYAWFSSNKMVDTGKITGRSSQQNVALLIDVNGNDKFSGKQECGIQQVNASVMNELMPVSTKDLQNFVYQVGTVENNAVSFQVLEQEKYYYHGVIYLKAENTNPEEHTKMAVYLDEYGENGGVFFSNMSGNGSLQDILNVVRIGLRPQNNSSKILRLSDGETTGRRNNTQVDGKIVGDGIVLTGSNGQIQSVADPSEIYTKYLVNEQGLVEGTSPLFYLEWNTVTALDIYVYLEGCDADCIDDISAEQFDFHIGLYGIVEKEAE